MKKIKEIINMIQDFNDELQDEDFYSSAMSFVICMLILFAFALVCVLITW